MTCGRIAGRTSPKIVGEGGSVAFHIGTPPQNFRSEFLEKHYLNK
jgi:hypothetical protein